tara:strand:+ start:36 stop:1118 length:1083 start_codon:yes stop_codon:yes gene_type:complete
MLSSDIINHLIKYLPQHTSLFNNNLPVISFNVVGNVITIVFSSNHNLINNDKILIHNALIDINIDTLTSDNGLITATTLQDHDLTKNWQENVTIKNSDIPTLNGSFKLNSVPNRKTFTFKNTTVINNPLGNPILLQNYDDNIINDFHTITVVDPITISINVPENIYTSINIENVLVSTKIRISGGSNLERVIDSYEGSSNIDYWLFVILDDCQIGKARSSPLDAVQNLSNLNAWNIEQLANFSIYAFIPSKNEITGRKARDIAEMLRLPLYKVLINSSFNPQLTSSIPMSNVTPLNDNIAGYSKSYYIHDFKWQQINQITSNDVFQNPKTKSFRNLNNIIYNTNNAIILNDNYNLDETPL